MMGLTSSTSDSKHVPFERGWLGLTHRFMQTKVLVL